MNHLKYKVFILLILSSFIVTEQIQVRADIFTVGEFNTNVKNYCPNTCPSGTAHQKDCQEPLDYYSNCMLNDTQCAAYQTNITGDDLIKFDLEAFYNCQQPCKSGLSKFPESTNFIEYNVQCLQHIAEQKVPAYKFTGTAWTNKQQDDKIISCQKSVDDQKLTSQRYTNKKSDFNTCENKPTYCENASKMFQDDLKNNQGKDNVSYQYMVCLTFLCEPDNTDTTSGLFQSQYNCLKSETGTFSYTKSQATEQEQVVEFTFGEFRTMKQSYCTVGCPKNDSVCSENNTLLKKCIDEDDKCKKYHTEMQSVEDSEIFDKTEFDNCYNKCAEYANQVSTSDFFKNYQFICTQTVADNKIPQYTYKNGKEWTTKNYNDYQTYCQTQADKNYTASKRYSDKVTAYKACLNDTTYCQNATTLFNKVHTDESGQGKVPYAQMVCLEECQPDNTTVQSGLFNSQYNCVVGGEEKFTYTISSQTEKEKQLDAFTYGDFRLMKSQYCTVACPKNDSLCETNNSLLKKCIDEDEKCSKYHTNMQTQSDDEKFDKTEFDNCYSNCSSYEEQVKETGISDFFLNYQFKCTQTVANDDIPVYTYKNGTKWTTAIYQENQTVCQTQADKNYTASKRYIAQKKAYNDCMSHTNYCINAQTQFDKVNTEQSGNGETPFEKMVCLELCQPDDSETSQLAKSGLFDAQYQCVFQGKQEFKYQISPQTENEIKADSFTYGNFRQMKSQYCTVGCPKNDSLCETNNSLLKKCIDEDEKCSKYHTNMQTQSDDETFDKTEFDNCYSKCSEYGEQVQAGISDFFLNYQFKCTQTVASNQTPVYTYKNGTKWTTFIYQQNQSVCQTEANKNYTDSKRYIAQKNAYTDCMSHTNYCINAQTQFKKIDTEQSGKGETPFEKMVCLEQCQPDDSETSQLEKSGLFDAQYQCVFQGKQEFTYQQSPATEKEQQPADDDDDDDDDQTFTFGKFRKIKDNYCTVVCPVGDLQCESNNTLFSKCIDKDDDCKKYHTELTTVSDKTPFDKEQFDKCYNTCFAYQELQDKGISFFFVNYQYNCSISASKNETPVFKPTSTDPQSIKQYVDNQDNCEDYTLQYYYRNKRYMNKKGEYQYCQDKRSSYCITAGKELNKLIKNGKQNDPLPYQSWACYQMCRPDNTVGSSKPASGLFTSEYSCYRNGKFDYQQSELTEDEGDDGADDPDNKNVEVQMGEIKSLVFKTELDEYQFTAILNSVDDVREMLVNFEALTLFVDFDFRLTINDIEKSQTKQLSDKSRISQNIYKIAGSDIEDDCDGISKCKVVLTVSIKDNHKGFDTDKVLGLSQIILESTTQEKVGDDSYYEIGPILITQSSDSLAAVSQSYTNQIRQKFLFKVYTSSDLDAERFVTIQDDLQNKTRFHIKTKIHNNEPTQIADWPIATSADIADSYSQEVNFDQVVLDKCGTEKCWYTISVYVYNQDKLSDGAFYVSVVKPKSFDINETTVSGTSDINKNKFMNAFSVKTTSDISFLNFDIQFYTQNSNASTYNKYQVQLLKTGDSLSQEHIQELGTYDLDVSGQNQFATISPAQGHYYIFFYYGYIETNTSINLYVNNQADLYNELDLSISQLLLQYNVKVKQHTVYKFINDPKNQSFKFKMNKDKLIEDDLVFIYYAIQEYQTNNRVPNFSDSEGKKWSSFQADHQGVIDYSLDLTKFASCNKKDTGCIVYLKIAYGNSSIPVGETGNMIALKVELGDTERIPMAKGQFREVVLSNYFPSDFLVSTLDASQNTLQEFFIQAQNFETFPLQFYVYLEDEQQSVDPFIIYGNTNASQIVMRRTKDQVQKSCKSSKTCKIRIEAERADGFDDKNFLRKVSCVIQFLGEYSVNEERIYGPVSIPHTNKYFNYAISQHYWRENKHDSARRRLLKEHIYTIYHFEVFANKGERKLVNLMQNKPDGSKFYIIGQLQQSLNQEFPRQTTDIIQQHLNNNRNNYDSARTALTTCQQNSGCYYLITVYIQEAETSQNTNSFYIEAQDFSKTYANLIPGLRQQYTTDPYRNHVMQSFLAESQNRFHSLGFNVFESKNPNVNYNGDDTSDNTKRRALANIDPINKRDQGYYVICMFDQYQIEYGQQLKVIDNLKTANPIGIMNPIDEYFIFYYSHSDKPIDVYMIYQTAHDESELYATLKKDTAQNLEFYSMESVIYAHYFLEDVATSSVNVDLKFTANTQSSKPLQHLKAQVLTFGYNVYNRVYPTDTDEYYTYENDFEKAGDDDKKEVHGLWKVDNQKTGCNFMCHMLFKFTMENQELQDSVPLKLSLKVSNHVTVPEPLPGSKLGLILGITFGGLFVVILGAFFFIRYQRKKQQNHLDYQDIEYQDKENKVSKFEEDIEEEEEN